MISLDFSSIARIPRLIYRSTAQELTSRSAPRPRLRSWLRLSCFPQRRLGSCTRLGAVERFLESGYRNIFEKQLDSSGKEPDRAYRVKDAVGKRKILVQPFFIALSPDVKSLRSVSTICDCNNANDEEFFEAMKLIDWRSRIVQFSKV